MIPVAMPQLIGNEAAYVADAIAKGQLSMGAYVARFEAGLAATCGVAHAVSCCNGTAALHLAVMAMGLQPGDEVIVPALTYVATANAVRYCGATPVFCDVDPDTWNLDVADVARRVTGRTRGVIAVHLYGVPAAMVRLADLCDARGLWLVEDAAEAIGAQLDGSPVGSFGDAATLSFYGNKVITCGEGGAVVTATDEVAALARLYRGQGVTAAGRYDHSVVGYNYRLGELQAAVGLAQLERLETHLLRRRAVCDQYRAWAGAVGLRFQHAPQGSRSADWMFTFVAPEGFDRATLATNLLAAGVQTRPAFPLVPRMPMYETREDYPVAREISERGLTLPTHGGLDQSSVTAICDAAELAIMEHAS